MTRSRVPGWLPLLAVVAVGGGFVLTQWPAEDPELIDVASSAPAYATLDALVAASDVVVVGSIRSLGEGRAVTDRADPAAGIRTSLFEIDVEQTRTRNDDPTADGESVIIEHETALLDGTPITIDGMAAPEVGERGLYFLVAGDSDVFPHHALVGPQGRYPLRGDTIEVAHRDPVASALEGMNLAEVMRQIDARE